MTTTTGDLFGTPDRPLPPWCRSAPDTSRQAAMSMLGSFTEIAQRIARYIAKRGPDGATCDEIEVALDLSHQTASARMWELAGKNQKANRPAVIVEAGRKRKARSGRGATVWIIA